jgi:hypothetical protein
MNAPAVPATDPAHKSHPAIEKLVAGGRSAGHGDAVGSGGVVLTPHQAGKVIRRLREESREVAEGHGHRDSGVEKILGELTAGP